MIGYVFTLLLVVISLASAILGFGEAQLEPMRYLFYLLLVPWGLILVAGFAVVYVTPVRCNFTTAPSELLNPAAFSTQNRLMRVGFETISQPMLFNSRPPTALLAMRQKKGDCFAAVYNPMINRDLLGIDLVSTFFYSDINGNHDVVLVTANLPDSGSMPLPSHKYLQIFPNDTIDSLVKEHQRAMRLLKENGLKLRPAVRSAFRPLFFQLVGRQQTEFIKNPIWNALVLGARSMSKASPHIGPISYQTHAMKAIKKYRQFANA